MKTYTAKAGEVEHGWFVVDAQDKVLGRLAVARSPRACAASTSPNTRRTWTPAISSSWSTPRSCASPAARPSARSITAIPAIPGGIKETNFAKLQATQPERVLQKAVKGMLPKGPLGYAMLRKLKVYAGGTHPHSAQQPKTLEI